MGRRGFGRAFGGLLRGLMLGGAAALLSGCGSWFWAGSPTYRFQMTVEVETPDGLKTGSSVYEVKTFGTKNLITGGTGSGARLRGEAVAVDLPGGKNIFALLQMARRTSSDDDLGMMSLRALDPAFNRNTVESAKRIVSREGIRSPAIVAPEDYPMLVTFTDIADPKSVARVEPDNLTAAFGPGVRLKRITVQVTDDEVTKGIEKRLPYAFWNRWGLMHKEAMNSSGGVMKNTYFSTLAGELKKDDFVTGISE